MLSLNENRDRLKMMMLSEKEKREILDTLSEVSNNSIVRRWWKPTTTLCNNNDDAEGWAVQEHREDEEGASNVKYHLILTFGIDPMEGGYCVRSYLRPEGRDDLTRQLSYRKFNGNMNWHQRLDDFFSHTTDNVEEAFEDCYIALHLLYS